MIGERFGYFTVLAAAPSKGEGPNFRARCDCGIEKEITGARLRSPRGPRSCGCKAIELRTLSRAKAPFEQRPLVLVQDTFVTDQRLLGKALIALANGPLTLSELAAYTRVDADEICARCEVLRGHVFASYLEGEWLAYLREETYSAVWEARARVLGLFAEEEEVARAA